MKDGLMKQMMNGQMRSDKMADEMREAIEVEATEAKENNSVQNQEAEYNGDGKAAEEKQDEKVDKSILINPKKTGKIKIEILRDGRIYLTGKNIKDNDELPLFLVTYGINMMLNKDVKPSYIMNGILNYKPFKEKMIVEQYNENESNSDKQKGLDPPNLSSSEVNPLMGMLGSMVASAAASKGSNNEVNNTESN